MAYFPQLISGATAQYPLARRVERRVIRTVQPAGEEWRVPDPGWRRVCWRLVFQDLTAEEVEQLEELFQEVEGRRGTFTFLDPAGNLLAWSEDLCEECWRKDPFVELGGKVPGPMGSLRAFRLWNKGTTGQVIEQVLRVPAWYQYCLSVWAQANQGEGLTLYVRASSAGEARRFRLKSGWQRLVLAARLQCSEDTVRFGAELEPGQVVDLFGFQAEPQGAPSAYKRTYGACGVYENARFAQDVLGITAEGPGRYSCTIEIETAR